MTSDPGLTRQDSDYASQIQAALDELQQMQEAPKAVTTPEELDMLERDIRRRTPAETCAPQSFETVCEGFHVRV